MEKEKSACLCRCSCESCSGVGNSIGQAILEAGASFYKIMSESMVRCTMQLPISFVQRLGVTETSCVILEGPSGQEWEVDLSGTKDCSVAFKRGWKGFATAHNLKRGDLLVFWMISESRFLVRMFDQTGCGKTAKLDGKTKSNLESSHIADSVRGKKRTGIQAQFTEEMTASKRNCKKQVNTEKSEIDLKSIKTEEHTLENNEGNMCSHKAFKFKVKEEADSEDAAHIQRALIKESPITSDQPREFRFFRTKVNMVSDRPLAAKNDNTKNLRDQEEHEIKEKKSNIATNGRKALTSRPKKVYITETFISQRRIVSKSERKKIVQKAESFKSSNPFVVISMKESHVYRGFWLVWHRRLQNHRLTYGSKIQLSMDMCSKSEEEQKKMCKYPYRSIIGSLLYA
ncbi:hypothetical protein O6H91_03G114000 [Diphasiastrum complanatum]|uniref:Uncharacterized protein n=1 Tax=Diphasiastrum complanatum TaxID=34168 RepID=A0ACC2EAY9_DIPCM|nr:hypothetical protein O6H91_03G114000 [Diphasiastrum complanatum]